MSDAIVQLREARARLKLKQAEAQLRRLEESELRRKRRATIREGADWGWDWAEGWTDVLDRLSSRGGMGRIVFPISTAQDRMYGANWPFWRTWLEHARLRASARLLYELSPLARGALNALASFVVGEGLTTRGVPRKGRTVPPALTAGVQQAFDDFSDANGWPFLQRELFIRKRRDGEYFLRDCPDERGMLLVRAINPECVLEPVGYPYGECSFGLMNEPDDIEDVWGYAVALDGNAARAEIVDAAEMSHAKCNVDRDVKRGLTDLCFDTHDMLRTAGRLLDNLGQGGAIQSAVALIRQHEAAGAQEAADFAAASADTQSTDPLTGNTVNREHWAPGTIVDIPKGMTYVPPALAGETTRFTEIVQALLRGVSRRWSMPEDLMTGDAGSTNYASILVAQSPFVLRCKEEQASLAHDFRAVARRALRCRCDAGRLRVLGRAWSYEEVCSLIDVEVEGRTVEVRDTQAEAATNKVYIELGVKSRQQAAMELGIDSRQTELDNAAWEKKHPPQPPPGAPGAPGGGKPPPDGKPPQPEAKVKPPHPGGALAEADAAGHEHKGKGEGGGQFTGGGAKKEEGGKKEKAARDAGVGRVKKLRADLHTHAKTGEAVADELTELYQDHPAVEAVRTALHRAGQDTRETEMSRHHGEKWKADKGARHRARDMRDVERRAADALAAYGTAEIDPDSDEGRDRGKVMGALRKALMFGRRGLRLAGAIRQAQKDGALSEGAEDDADFDPDEAAPLIAELLYHIFGDDALAQIKGLHEAWNADDHPRGAGGKFIPKGSAEAVSAAKEAVHKALKKGEGDAADVAKHLALLTVKQLRELHQQNGVKKIPKEVTRAHLVAAVHDRLAVRKDRKADDAKAQKEKRDQDKAAYAARGQKGPEETAAGAGVVKKKAVAKKKKEAGGALRDLTAERRAAQQAEKEAAQKKDEADTAAFLHGAGAPVYTQTHGMGQGEDMHTTRAHGMRVRFTPATAHVARRGMEELGKVAAKMPQKLMAATRGVIFSAQANSQDDHWKATYKNFGTSTATGGDGQIVVYSGKGMSVSTFAHEAGHNLATATWGSTKPPPDSEYGKAQVAEKPVSDYGENSPAEDFAEAVKMYVTEPVVLAPGQIELSDMNDREYLKKNFPLKFAAVEALLK